MKLAKSIKKNLNKNFFVYCNIFYQILVIQVFENFLHSPLNVTFLRIMCKNDAAITGKF